MAAAEEESRRQEAADAALRAAEATQREAAQRVSRATSARPRPLPRLLHVPFPPPGASC